MSDSYLIDDDEEEIMTAFQEGKLKRAPDADHLMKAARQAAENYLKKNARINIRVSDADLSLLKCKAAEEGLPYQTLIASVLHKFVTGRLVSRT